MIIMLKCYINKANIHGKCNQIEKLKKLCKLSNVAEMLTDF